MKQKVKPEVVGPRPVGKPPITGTAQIRSSVMMPIEHHNLYLKLGKGNVSAGMRVTADYYLASKEGQNGKGRKR